MLTRLKPVTSSFHSPPFRGKGEKGGECHCKQTVFCKKINVTSSSLPPQRFRALFNFLSEFFSPFRRRTCSLSVSPERLALDGIYHPIWAAVPSDPTPGRVSARRDPRGAAYGAVALRGAALPGGFDPPRAPAGTRPETTIRRSRGTGDFGIG
jgi:hypothetical protein